MPAELEQLRKADAAGVPVLGICFGGQLVATAHGGSVALSPTPEIGWTEISTAAPDLVPEGPWFEWHYDRWQLPPDATELARNAAASQAFVLRRNLAVQFHPELTTAILTDWLRFGGESQAIAAGINPQDLISGTATAEPDSRRRAHALVDAFLTSVAI